MGDVSIPGREVKLNPTHILALSWNGKAEAGYLLLENTLGPRVLGNALPAYNQLRIVNGSIYSVRTIFYSQWLAAADTSCLLDRKRRRTWHWPLPHS